jgi:hypothetical protein
MSRSLVHVFGFLFSLATCSTSVAADPAKAAAASNVTPQKQSKSVTTESNNLRKAPTPPSQVTPIMGGSEKPRVDPSLAVQPVRPLDVRPEVRRNMPAPVARLADNVNIQLSGVHPEGGSLVSEARQRTLFGSPRFTVLITHTPLSLQGALPGEERSYGYYLLVQNQSLGPPQCRFDPATGRPVGTVDHPDIQRDGLIQWGSSTGGNITVRDVIVPQAERSIIYYFARVCILGVVPGSTPREFRAVSSNLADFSVMHR